MLDYFPAQAELIELAAVVPLRELFLLAQPK
jgi:hypothetical protein